MKNYDERPETEIKARFFYLKILLTHMVIPNIIFPIFFFQSGNGLRKQGADRRRQSH